MSVPPSMHRPSEVRRHDIPAASGKLAALVGEPPPDVSRRPDVLLVPGYTGSKEDFLPILAPLARAGHRAIAIDLRGQYESTGPDDAALYTIESLAKDVAAALDALGGPVHLVGHSFGGLVTRRTVINGARPLSLALVGSGPAALPGNRAAIVEMMRPVIVDGGVEAIAAAAAAIDREDPTMAGLPAEVTEFLYARWLAASPTGLLTMGEELLAAVDEVDRLAATGVPTYVVHGETDDAWPPADQQQMARRLGAGYASVPGAGHSPACEAPERLVEVLLDFWSA